MFMDWKQSCVSSAAWGWQPCMKEFSIMTVTGCGLQGAARTWASGALRAWRSCRSPALTMSTLMPSHLMEVRMHSFCFKSFPVSKPTALSVCDSKILLSSSARNLGLRITGTWHEGRTAYKECLLMSLLWTLPLQFTSPSFSVDVAKTFVWAVQLVQVRSCIFQLFGWHKLAPVYTSHLCSSFH